MSQPSPTWIARAWRQLVALFSRAEPVAQPDFGADFALPTEIAPTYDLRAAMSAYQAFPWVYAAMIRRSTDMAGLPLQVVRGRGRRAKIIDDHPLHELLDQTSSNESGRQFRMQMTIDHRLTGNHYTALFGKGSLMSLVRLHPHRVRIRPSRRTGVAEFVFTGALGEEAKQVYPREQILHLRMPSWEDDPRGLYGSGAIGALHDDLTTDRRASRRAAEQAKRGRPDMLISPDPKDDGGGDWSAEFREEIKKKADRLLEAGGVLVFSDAMKAEMPTWSPRDMEFPALRQLVREAVLAVTGVPPHMVGLPTANYALAEAQERTYWQLLVGDAQSISDAVWTPLARRFDRRLSIRHDFSGVDVLQAGRDARLNRVVIMVEKLNADPAEAAAFEGLPDMPVGPRKEPAPAAATPPQLTADDPEPDADTDTEDPANEGRGQVIDGRGLFGLPKRRIS
ncbi:MAG: phage portal protein [Planctomycetota bacterium]